MNKAPKRRHEKEKMRVVVRVRAREVGEEEGTDCIFANGNTATALAAAGEMFSANFDAVFGQQSTQAEVFTSVAPLVDSWVDGYHACVFAYGQTCSGKTYTMLGADGGKVAHLDGIIPQVADRVFDTIAREEAQFTALFGNTCQSQYKLRASYVEVYNNDVRDLLGNSATPQILQVKENAAGDVFVDGCKEVDLECTKDIVRLIKRGAERRRTGRTNMNVHSSRSHAVLKLTLEHRWRDAGDGARQYRCKASHLNLVDLAGSERQHRTANTDVAFRESVSINTGLLALGNVLASLGGDKGRGREHIPYRDSALTRLLQNSLGGGSRTLMLACVSPSACNMDEALGTLRYARGTMSIEVAPRQHIAVVEEEAGAMDGDVEDPEEYLGRRCEWVDTAHHGPVFARCVGNPTDPLILFVHGSGPNNSSVWWNGLIHELALTSATSYLYVAIDCPGYGLSVGDKQTIRSEPGAFLLDVIRSLGRRKAYALCGSSQGSCATFNAVLECPNLAEYIVVMDPVGHDVFRYKNITQPSLLIFDTEDAGHPVKVGRWMRDALPNPHYFEFSAKTEPYWHVDNMAGRMLGMFKSYATKGADLVATTNVTSIMTRVAGGIVKWCEAGGSGRATKQIEEGLLASPSSFVQELLRENEAASRALDGHSHTTDEWVITADTHQGRVFYVNKRTGDSTFTPPRNARLVYDAGLQVAGGGEGTDLFAEEEDTQEEVESDAARDARLAAEQCEETCGVCADLLWEPLRFAVCRHVLCTMCHTRCLVKYSKMCPICDTPSTTEKSEAHMKHLTATVDGSRLEQREKRHHKEVDERARASRVIVEYGNTAVGVSGECYTVKAYVKVAKAERGSRSKVSLSGAIKTAEFNINPRYPKAAVKVTTAPFTLERTMISKFPCHMTVKWADTTLAPVLIPYYVAHEAKTARFVSVSVTGAPTQSVKTPVKVEGKYPEVYL